MKENIKQFNAVPISKTEPTITETWNPDSGINTTATNPITIRTHPSMLKNVARPQSF